MQKKKNRENQKCFRVYKAKKRKGVYRNRPETPMLCWI